MTTKGVKKENKNLLTFFWVKHHHKLIQAKKFATRKVMKAQNIKLQRKSFSSLHFSFHEKMQKNHKKILYWRCKNWISSFLMQAKADNLHFLSFTFPANPRQRKESFHLLPLSQLELFFALRLCIFFFLSCLKPWSWIAKKEGEE